MASLSQLRAKHHARSWDSWDGSLTYKVFHREAVIWVPQIEKSGKLQLRPIFRTSPLNDFHLPFKQTLNFTSPLSRVKSQYFHNPFNQLELWRGASSPRQPFYLILFLLRTHFFIFFLSSFLCNRYPCWASALVVTWHTWPSYKPHRNTQPKWNIPIYSNWFQV